MPSVIAHALIGVCCFLLCPHLLRSSDPLDYWAWRSPRTSGNNLFSIAAGRGTHVAVGEWGTILTSDNGTDWEDRSLPWSSPILKVAFGSGIFVAHTVAWPDQAVGYATLYLLTSIDGEMWSVAYARAAPAIYGRTESINDFVYANGMFVAVGGNDSFVNEERVTMILTSPDGTNWTPRVSQPGKSLYAVAHATDHFVAVGQEGLAMTSTDGFVWSVSDTLGVWSFVDVTRFHDRFVALGNSWINGPSVIYSSSDGEQWQFEAEITSYGQMRCLASYGDGLLTAGEAGKAFISSNLKEWAKYDLPRGQDMFGAEVIGTESFFVGARGTLLSGESGSEWRVRPRDLGAHVFPGTAFGGGRFVTVTSTGKGFYSDDGVTWTASTMPTNLHLNRVTYGAGKFVAVGLGDSIVISTNGQSWHLVLGDGGFGDELNDVTWDGKHFLSIADSGLTFTSEDGLSWQSHDARGLGDFWCVTSGGGLFVAYRGSSIYTSIDAVNWIAQTNNINHQILIAGAYGQGRFVLVGDGGDAWTSTNGYHWTATNILQYWTLSDVVFAGDRFVTAGIGGYVFSSKDGSTWEVHLAPGPPQIFSLAFGRDTVVAAGAGMLFQSDPLHEAVRTVRGVRKLADGKLRLSLLGLPGSIYDLQMSHDLNEWESLDVLFAPSGRLTFDIDASGQATYYRAANALLRPSLRP